jgi:hypothetical protein
VTAVISTLPTETRVSGDPRIKCVCDTVGGKAIWPRLLYDKVFPRLASGEPGVRPLREEALGRGVTVSGTTVGAGGGAGARRDRVPW